MTTPNERMAMRRKGQKKKKERAKRHARQKHETRIAARQAAGATK